MNQVTACVTAAQSSQQTDQRILVVEDDPDISHLLEIHLRDLDFEVDVVANGTEGLDRACTRTYELVVLDLMLPGLDGLEVCRRLRQLSERLPILMLSAKSSELDRVLGLELGADDYLTKPFSIMELKARIKAILRRTSITPQHGRPEDGEVIHLASMEIDVDGRHVHVDSAAVELTAMEFDLLLYFARHPGRVFSRCQLLDQVWGYGHSGYEHTVNTHINRLRKKIEPAPQKPRYIETVWGVGYRLRNV